MAESQENSTTILLVLEDCQVQQVTEDKERVTRLLEEVRLNGTKLEF